MIIKCDHCKKDFNKKPSRIKLSNQHFCSAECRNSGSLQTKRTGKDITCLECGTVVYKNPSELKKSKSGKHFCSKKCAEVSNGRDRQGVNHPNWIDGKSTYRERAIEAYGSRCNRCGYNEYKSVLQVHHKDHKRSNNNVENLEVLCPTCHCVEHMEVHKGFINKPVP